MLDRSLACDEVVANVSWNRAATIDANGQVLIVNSAGVLFSRGSRVNAGCLSPRPMMSRRDFIAGNYTLLRHIECGG